MLFLGGTKIGDIAISAEFESIFGFVDNPKFQRDTVGDLQAGGMVQWAKKCRSSARGGGFDSKPICTQPRTGTFFFEIFVFFSKCSIVFSKFFGFVSKIFSSSFRLHWLNYRNRFKREPQRHWRKVPRSRPLQYLHRLGIMIHCQILIHGRPLVDHHGADRT